MKGIIAIVSLFIVSCLPLWATLADGAPKSVPLVSRAQLKAYALSQVNWLSGGISGQTVSGDGRYFSVPYAQADGDPVAIAAAVKVNKVTFSVDPTEKISTFANWEVRTPDGSSWGAFYGQRDFNLIKDASGNFQIPSNATTIDDMELGTVPFPIKGVNNAHIKLKNSAGFEGGTYSFGERGFVRNGYIILTSEHTAQNGELFVYFNDGSQAIYVLSDGKQKTMASVTAGGFSTAVKGVRTLPDNTVDITYGLTDEVVRVKYTLDTSIKVSFGVGVVLPLKVLVVEEKLFRADPNATGNSFDPSKDQVVMRVGVGKSYLILFVKPSPVIYTDNGKG